MFGWFSQRYADFRRWNTDQTQILYMVPEDSTQYLDAISRREIVRRVEWLLQTFGIVKEGGRGMARHAVGKGLTLQLNTKSLKWNAAAEAQFEEYAITPGRFDIAGRRNFYETQLTAVEQLIWRGEFFASGTNNPRWINTIADKEIGEPCWQLWDTNEVGTHGELEEGRDCWDGVKLDQFHNPVGYYVKAKNERGYDFIPAAAMVHWYQPLGINQIRGESAFAPSIKRLVHWHDMERLVIQHAKTHSTLAVAVKKLARIGGRGFQSRIKNATADATGSTPSGVDTEALEKAYPGLVAYLGQDGEVQLLKGDSPNEKLQPFLSDLIAPNVFAALGVPAEFFWDPSKLSSANQRFILSRADLTFQVTADSLIYRFCNQVAYRFLQHRISTGKLEAPPDDTWSATMTWQTPRRTSIDNARDAKSAIELVAQGMGNLRGWYDSNGQGWRPETRQWIREWLEFEEMCKDEGATPDQIERLMERWRPLLPGAGNQQQDDPNADPPDPPKPKPQPEPKPKK